MRTILSSYKNHLQTRTFPRRSNSIEFIQNGCNDGNYKTSYSEDNKSHSTNSVYSFSREAHDKISNESTKQEYKYRTTLMKKNNKHRLLHFFQRGFRSRLKEKANPTSIPYHESGSADSLPGLGLCTVVDQTPLEAVRILHQQIRLPHHLLIALRKQFDCDDSFKEWEENDQSPTTTVTAIHNVDSSLVRRKTGVYFKITSTLTTDAQGSDVHEKQMPADRSEIHLYGCPTIIECDRWMMYLKRLVRPNMDQQRRQENLLHVWIQEAKGLIGQHKYHCEILLDGKLYARTASKWLTDMLFWGEEFDLSGLPDFQDLSVELWLDSCNTEDREKCVTNAGRSRSGSSPLLIICHKPTGQIKPSVKYRENQVKFTARESHDLESISDDFHRSISALYQPEDKELIKPLDNKVMNNRRGKSKQHKLRSLETAIHIATVSIPKATLTSCSELEKWYPITEWVEDETHFVPKGKRFNKTKNSTRCAVQLRIKTRYQCVDVLPLNSYARLQRALTQIRLPDSVNAQSSGANDDAIEIDSTTLFSCLDPWLTVKSKTDLAGSMVAFNQAVDNSTEFLSALLLQEIRNQTDLNMVLRANTIATKAMEIYLRLIGPQYLFRTLSSFVQLIIHGQPTVTSTHASYSPMDCEVDPIKVENPKQLAQNQENLLYLVNAAWKRIMESVAYFPSELREIFYLLRHRLSVGELNSSTSLSAPTVTVAEHVISALLFLRYICPAILSPSLFGLLPEFPSDPRVLRTFTLVAKTIQLLANFSLVTGTKESYMTFMNSFVADNLTKMRRFLNDISTPVNLCIQIPTPGMCVVNGQGSFGGSNSYHEALGSLEHNMQSTIKSSTIYQSTECLESGGTRTLRRNSTLLADQPGMVSSTTPPNKPSKANKTPVVNFFTLTETANACVHEPIRLPCLPPSWDVSSNQATTTNNKHGDHIDLGLCLALCHSQLTEAITRIPVDNLPQIILQFKPILDEIDYFSLTGNDPDPNWWTPMTPTVKSGFSALNDPVRSANKLSIVRNCDARKYTTTSHSTPVASQSPNVARSHENMPNIPVKSGPVVAKPNWLPIVDNKKKQHFYYPVPSEQHNNICQSNGTSQRSRMDDHIISGNNYEIFHHPKPDELEPPKVPQHRCTVDGESGGNSTPTKHPPSEFPPEEDNTIWSMGTTAEMLYNQINKHDHTEKPSVCTTEPILQRLQASNSSGYQSMSGQDHMRYTCADYVIKTGQLPVESSNIPSHGYSNPIYDFYPPNSNLSISDSAPSPNLSSTNGGGGGDMASPSMVEAVPLRAGMVEWTDPMRKHLKHYHAYVNLDETPTTAKCLQTIINRPQIQIPGHSATDSDRSMDDVKARNTTPVRSSSSSATQQQNSLAAQDEAMRMVTTLHTLLEGYDIRPPFVGNDSNRSCGWSRSKRPFIPWLLNESNLPPNIRDELDASQARLSVAQARLHANEIERMELLRTWQTELILQSQLLNEEGVKPAVGEPIQNISGVRQQHIWQIEPPSPSPIPQPSPTPLTHTPSQLRVNRSTYSSQPRMGASTLHDPSGFIHSTMPRMGLLTPYRERPQMPWFMDEPPLSTSPNQLTRSPSTPGLVSVTRNVKHIDLL